MAFSSPSWSLNYLKGSLIHPEKVTKNCQVVIGLFASDIYLKTSRPSNRKLSEVGDDIAFPVSKIVSFFARPFPQCRR